MMGKGYYEDEEVFKYVDELGICQTAHKKDAPMFEHQRQPKRSKREDFDYEKLADVFYNTQITKEDVVNCEEEEGALKVLEKFAKYLNQRCGALNTVETQ